MKLLVAIPALNEAESIGNVIVQVRNYIPQAFVLVIDDGSTDTTAETAKLHGASVLSLPFNVGVGGALKVAFKYAQIHGFNSVLQIDADGQHLPEEAVNLIMKATQDSIVVGSRFIGNDHVYKIESSRRIAINILAKVMSYICREKLTDVTSGFRLSTGRAVELFASNYPRDYLGDTVESLIIANRAGIPIIETSVKMKNRIHGNPSQNFVKSTWYLIRILLVISLALSRPSIRRINEK